MAEALNDAYSTAFIQKRDFDSESTMRCLAKL